MLTPADDYPLHQTADPIAFSGTDRNFYDRFFFNGYDREQNVFFALALGVYPHLDVMDGGLCVRINDRQYNLRCSKEMLMDRLNLEVGPLSVEIVEPLRQTRLVIADNEYGIYGELVATARHAAVEEPRFTRRNGARAFMDYTRATQNVSWQGHIYVAGQRVDLNPGNCLGTRDRSWGIRPVGMSDPQTVTPVVEPQFYWLWTPMNFDNASLFCHSNEDRDGNPWNRRAVWVDHKTGAATHFEAVSLNVQFNEASRRIEGLSGLLTPHSSASSNKSESVEFQIKTGPLFYMQGLGYTHPTWNHGLHHGSLEVAYDELDCAEAEAQLAAGTIQNLHVQALSEITVSSPDGNPKGNMVGYGVTEQLFIGKHVPSGFNSVLDRIMK